MFYWGLVLGLWGVIAAGGTLAWVGSTLPPIQSLEVPKRPPTIEIVGLDGRPLATRGEMSGTDVPIKELPPYVPKAFIAIEDRRFLQPLRHRSDRARARRVRQRRCIAACRRAARPSPSSSPRTCSSRRSARSARKMQEAVLALWLERKFSKDEILELYLNRVYFGAGAYGIEAAAQRYFGKPARQVKLAEAAMLAGLVKSPSRLAPTRNPDARRAPRPGRARRHGGAGLHHRDHGEGGDGHRPPASCKPAGAGSVNYVADWIMDVLDDLVGRVEQDLVVETSIDPDAAGGRREGAGRRAARRRARNTTSHQGALVAMTPDGAVRALVGGRTTPRASSTARSPPSASPARRSSRSSI